MRWWLVNRPAAPDAIQTDIEAALALIAMEPGVGSRINTSRRSVVRRIHMPRIGYFAYYRVRNDCIEVLCLWHERRGTEPRV
jgi:plasmid stabilization system protein ParE